MTSNIKNVIDIYIKKDDELKVLNKERSVLLSEKKLLSEQISDYLEKNSTKNSVLELGNNVFKILKYKKNKINKSSIEDVLKLKIKDENTVKEIIEEITEEKEESVLKRIIKK